MAEGGLDLVLFLRSPGFRVHIVFRNKLRIAIRVVTRHYLLQVPGVHQFLRLAPLNVMISWIRLLAAFRASYYCSGEGSDIDPTWHKYTCVLLLAMLLLAFPWDFACYWGPIASFSTKPCYNVIICTLAVY